ncbi:hypothetical protein NMG60_11021022 [Bertholletia excelsa]
MFKSQTLSRDMHCFPPNKGEKKGSFRFLSPLCPDTLTMDDVEAKKPEYEVLKPWASNKGKGGFKATLFIFALVMLDNIGFVANMVSLVLYFNLKMQFDLAGSANTLTNFMGATFLLSIVGGFISDTFLNRFDSVVVFGTLEVLSLALMTIQAHYPSLLPEPCGKSHCLKGVKAVMFYASLALLALGNGGVRGSLPPLGADQFDQKDPTEAKALASYFNYLVLSSTVGATVGVTVVVWVSMNKGWWWGFLIYTVLSTLGFAILILGKPLYRLQMPSDVPLVRIARVLFVSIRNRRMSLPENPDELYEVNEKESNEEEKIPPTQQFRCLDKAAILPENTTPSPWKVCTVTQVEEVKVLTRMMPIIASTIIMNTCLAQLQTFSVQQGYRMNRFLGSFQVPAPSIPVIPLVFMAFLIPLYDLVFVPFARKLTGHPSGITQLQRVGVGLVLSVVSMAVAALIEVKRRHQSLKNPLQPISLFWLSFQYGIFGIADMFTLVGLLEFFYKEAPTCMKSLSTSFTWISLSLGYFLSTVFVDIINAVTRRITPSKQGWLHGQDLDRNNLNLFYWFLAILSCLNFANYLYWASWYKYKADEPKPIQKSPMIRSTSAVPFLRDENSAAGDATPASNGAAEGKVEEEKVVRV